MKICQGCGVEEKMFEEDEQLSVGLRNVPSDSVLDEACSCVCEWFLPYCKYLVLKVNDAHMQ